MNTDVVTLLADVQITGSDPRQWRHFDGRPLTRQEIELVGSATPGDLRAAADYQATAAEYAVGQATDLRRMAELCRPYFARGARTIAACLAMMTPAERGEAEGIAARLAPDGTVVVPRPDHRG